MEKTIITKNEVRIALIHSDVSIINNTQDALDIITSIAYADNCERIALNKNAVTEAFFTLSSGIAGEILQKFVTYSIKLAIIGDFSGYTSKALRDFIYECNKGTSIAFVASEQEALEKLSKA